ncbi:MAG TPA: gephyrin-like molybdotransferase receptor GlpR [Mycobacterium sp.]|nr:gephyrin-like molybdotransferase receptor GlpR [Mycobacterium sp.]
MPSIPQSLLWISLVVLWLFVLVPMLISKRDTVRRTSDVALATRVLNTGSGARLLRRRKPAAGHHSDPDWRPAHDDLDEYDDDDRYEDREPVTAPRKTVVVMTAAKVQTESEYLDVDVVEEDSGALPIGASAQLAFDQEPELPLEFDANTATFTVDDLQEVDDHMEIDDEIEDEGEAEAEFEADDEAMTDEFASVSEDDTDYDYDYVDDSSGLEAAPDPDLHVAGTKSQERRRNYESKTAAAVSARKFRFRKRMLMAMSALLLASAVAAYVVSPTFWWVCGTVGTVTVLYLGYLRRQTRIEEQVRRRRAQRMLRSHLGVENTHDPEFDVVPARLRRPGAVVLEIDDEDPIFEHLDYAPFAREYDLPRAAGQ